MSSPDSEKWKIVINQEFETIVNAGTYVDVEESRTHDLPSSVIPSGVILELKRNERGRPSRFKARLVARVNLQDNRNETCENRYAPVACFELVRILLVLSVAFGWSKQQIDIKGAFLYSKLPNTSHIWIRLPKIDGVNEADGRIVKLIKSLYGLRDRSTTSLVQDAFRTPNHFGIHGANFE